MGFCNENDNEILDRFKIVYREDARLVPFRGINRRGPNRYIPTLSLKKFLKN